MKNEIKVDTTVQEGQVAKAVYGKNRFATSEQIDSISDSMWHEISIIHMLVTTMYPHLEVLKKAARMVGLKGIELSDFDRLVKFADRCLDAIENAMSQDEKKALAKDSDYFDKFISDGIESFFQPHVYTCGERADRDIEYKVNFFIPPYPMYTKEELRAFRAGGKMGVFYERGEKAVVRYNNANYGWIEVEQDSLAQWLTKYFNDHGFPKDLKFRMLTNGN